MPYLRAGTVFRMAANRCARFAKSRHHSDTNANWTTVRVIGFGNALRIDLDEVFVRAELRYHVWQRS